MDDGGPGEQAAWHPWLVSHPDAALPDAEARAGARLRGPAPMLLVLALAVAGGLLADAAGPARRIDLLSPPFLAVVGWNLGVYAVLAVAALRRKKRPPAQQQRALDIARLLHAGAAALALGLCIGLYARGLVFDYRAGWQSTFLEPPQVHALLATVLAPASTLTGIAVPGVEGIAALRLAAGATALAPAAAWIHLFAVTLLMFVVLPRAALAARAGLLARRMDAAARVPATAVAAPSPLAPAPCRVLPHALATPDAAALVRALGAPVDLLPGVAFGAEGLASVAPGIGAVQVLVPLAATPEAEHHGVLLQRLKASAPTLLVEESAYAARFRHDPGRIEERRTAWRDFAAAHGAGLRFIDLGAD
jgi:hypothetical protein